MGPTSKQTAYVERIVAQLGRQYVQTYISADLDNLTRQQAQKIITGLGSQIARPVYGVVGRDIPFSR